MTTERIASIQRLLEECSEEERHALFRQLRAVHQIHEFEAIVGAPAEMILEAVHRAPELTRRMLRGVIADAAFNTYVVEPLAPNWRNVTPEGNFAFDYKLDDGRGPITVQVKLQRSEHGSPVIRKASRYEGFSDRVFIVETQKTRTGTDGGEKTRPYRYGEFDVLAVSMQPSCGTWSRFKYTLGRWLIPRATRGEEMATLQPVATDENDFWTDDFTKVAAWFRSHDRPRQMCLAAPKSHPK